MIAVMLRAVTMDATEPAGTDEPATRPMSGQALLINFAAAYLCPPDEELPEIGLPASIAISLAQRARIGEASIRTALNRMVDRDLLDRVRIGRTTVYFATQKIRAALREGQTRMLRRGVVRDDADTHWVLLAFTLNAAAQRERHVLRSRLTWAGFGLLQGGLWIAAEPVDLDAVVTDPSVRPFVQIFRAEPVEPTDIAALAPSVWDLTSLAEAYLGFIAEWGSESLTFDDPLIEQLTLGHSWLELIRRDPRLPRWCLPDDWPAEDAERVYHSRLSGVAPAAQRVAAQLLRDAPSSS